MIRAVFFDFYSVWAPDKLAYYLAYAQLYNPDAYKELYDLVEKYYRGETDINNLADTFRYRLGHTDITASVFQMNENNISPQIIEFVRSLHGHFLKVGILANLGRQEFELLNGFNERNQLFETIASPMSLNIKSPLLNRDVFVAALNGIGEPPESTLIISGNPYYLAFAANLGVNTLMYDGLVNLQTSLPPLLSADTNPQ